MIISRSSSSSSSNNNILNDYVIAVLKIFEIFFLLLFLFYPTEFTYFEMLNRIIIPIFVAIVGPT
jgi:hypothetical protein